MRTALISDIHGNLSALEAVLADIASRGCDRKVCLGDIVGYGPDPRECVDLVAQHCEWSLMGNHDFGVLYEPTHFNAAAEKAAYWTRGQLEADAGNDREGAQRRWDFLGRLRVRVAMDDFLAVHGTPRRPINEYLFPEDAQKDPRKLEQIFDRAQPSRHIMVGHTHVPGVFVDEPDFVRPDDMTDATYTFSPEERVIVNPGSVGQPRDLDPRASYAMLESDSGGRALTIQFIRVPYDIERTVGRILAIPELSNWLGERLREGR